MKTLTEIQRSALNYNKKMGNYVSLDAAFDLGRVMRAAKRAGVSNAVHDVESLHITLMYSPEGEFQEDLLDDQKVSPFFVRGDEWIILGDCVALHVKSPKLMNFHRALWALGLNHTYVHYTPHMTVASGLNEEEAARFVKELNDEYRHEMVAFIVSNLKHEPIDESWSGVQ